MSKSETRRWNNELTVAGVVLLILLPLLGMTTKTYLTLTIAGLAMGMLLFLVASGVSIIFGLMDVLNFAHGALFAWGAYVGFSVFGWLRGWVEADSVLQNFGVFFVAILAAMAAVAGLGVILERVVIRRVYGNHLFQILITFGATIVLVELIRVFWGPNDEVMIVPMTFRGSWDIFDIIIAKYRIICIFIGIAVYAVIQLILKKTKIGMIVRAGVENREMVQAMGHNIFLLFTGVFAAGAGLAALGGLAMSIFSLQVYPDMGSNYLLFAFIVVIIGGLGSVTGSLVGALIVGLSYNYVAYLVPWAAAGVNILIMIIILLIRPTGLFAAGK
jgi:branched-chain amino acid transport system permease protein